MSGLEIDIEHAIELIKDFEKSSPKYFIEFDKRNFKPSDLGISARAINNWKEKRLLFKENKKGWIRFNLTESIWIKIIQQLRKFNIPLDTIMKIKLALQEVPENVMNHLDKKGILDKLKQALENESISELKTAFDSENLREIEKKEKLSILDHIILDMITTRANCRLLFNSEGNTLIYKDNYEEELREYPEYWDFLKTTHISISLNQLFYSITNELIEPKQLAKLKILNSKEQKILDSLREDKIKKIEISYKENEPQLIKVTKINKLDTAARIKEILISKGYQDIKLTTQNGKLVQCENTKKKKL
jgi:DNA-binding transcriptional MerR regulator